MKFLIGESEEPVTDSDIVALFSKIQVYWSNWTRSLNSANLDREDEIETLVYLSSLENLNKDHDFEGGVKAVAAKHGGSL